MAVDLHVHTTASDGTLTPEQVVRVAVSKGLSAIAITDHDTVAGLAPAAHVASQLDIDLLPAVEVSAQDGKRELHILGFLIDPAEPNLRGSLQTVRESREERAGGVVERLQALGIKITYDDVLASAQGGSIGRPHIAAALVARGAVSSPAEAFQRYLRRGKPGYVDRYRLPWSEALDLIRGAGGLSVLAHPGLGCPDSIVHRLAGMGLGGIEAYHVDHSKRQTQHYLEIANKLGLVATGGTDSHGPQGPAPVEIGQVQVPDECAEAVREWGRAHSRWPSP